MQNRTAPDGWRVEEPHAHVAKPLQMEFSLQSAQPACVRVSTSSAPATTDLLECAELSALKEREHRVESSVTRCLKRRVLVLLGSCANFQSKSANSEQRLR